MRFVLGRSALTLCMAMAMLQAGCGGGGAGAEGSGSDAGGGSISKNTDTDTPEVISVQEEAYCDTYDPNIWDTRGAYKDGPWGRHTRPEIPQDPNKPLPYMQPILGACIPRPAAPLGEYDLADFDADGVPNIADNCLLVANPDQAPAIRSGDAIGPSDMLALAAQWKAAHPDARFRTDEELGEACSGYNTNYLQTTKALIESPDARKVEVFKFMGAAGPMYGGSPAPLSADPAPANEHNGNLAASLPLCSNVEQYVRFVSWMFNPGGGQGNFMDMSAFGDTGGEQMSLYGECGTNPLIRSLTDDVGFELGWAGKRLYTDTDGGRITNRFVPLLSESPVGDLLATVTGLPGLDTLGFFPYGTGQTRHGYIFRGKSYMDGHSAIVMDWREKGPYGFGTEASSPAQFYAPNMGGLLIYDECRAIQTGVYNCTAMSDWIRGSQRYHFRDGWMPWVVKGPPSRQEYRDAIR